MLLCDKLLRSLERKAHAKKMSKRAIAQAAGIHINSLRHFNAPPNPPLPKAQQETAPKWSPTMKILRKVEAALSSSG